MAYPWVGPEPTYLRCPALTRGRGDAAYLCHQVRNPMIPARQVMADGWPQCRAYWIRGYCCHTPKMISPPLFCLILSHNWYDLFLVSYLEAASGGAQGPSCSPLNCLSGISFFIRPIYFFGGVGGHSQQKKYTKGLLLTLGTILGGSLEIIWGVRN